MTRSSRDAWEVFFARFTVRPDDPELELVANTLDPVLSPLGFTQGQLGTSDRQAQVIFCRGERDSVDGACVDLVIDLVEDPDWRISDVRNWGYPSDRWHLAFPQNTPLGTQLAALSRSLPDELR